MGQKRKECPSAADINKLLSSMLVPEYILKDFEIWDVTSDSSSWTLELREKTGRLPKELESYPDVVFDGYCNPIDILCMAFVGKPVYLRVYRRRYKRSNSNTHYNNDYEFTIKGIKMTPEMSFFLKG
jgi:hypothetical protein